MTVAVAVALIGGLCATLARAQQGRGKSKEDFSVYLPPGKAQSLVAKECSTCHDLGGMIQLRKPKDGWEAIVLDMVARGAPLMIEDVDPMIDYLTDVFGPKAPPLVDVNTAGKEDLTKLHGVTPEAAERLIAHRTEKGPLTSRDEVRTVLGLDAPAFDKIKYYLRVSTATNGR